MSDKPLSTPPPPFNYNQRRDTAMSGDDNKALTMIQVMLGRIEERQKHQTVQLDKQSQQMESVEKRVVKRLDEHATILKEHDKRIRDNEKRSAVIGALGGSAAGIGVSLIVAAMKEKVGL